MADISIWQFPLSVAAAAAFLGGLFLLWRFLPDGLLRRTLSGMRLCLGTTVAVIVLMAVEGSWGFPVHRSWPFFAVALLLMLSLGFTTLDALERKARFSYLATHLGFFILAAGTFWGAPDVVDCSLAVSGEQAVSVAMDREGRAVELPFSIRLVGFRTEYYEDGTSPKQYSSDLELDGQGASTSVNHPCRKNGYSIYQMDYDRASGRYSVLKLVRDPWLPLIFLGMLLMAAGAVASLGTVWDSWKVLLAALAVAALFAAFSLARINFGTLMPALRSLWFVPHLLLYMLAYSALALALVFLILRRDRLSGRLFATSSALLLLGMLCGAVWAKAAWGDWWTWDAKECWAAVTWLLTLTGLHVPAGTRRRRTAVAICMILAFLAMQITWYGVDWLPASQMSLHSYR